MKAPGVICKSKKAWWACTLGPIPCPCVTAWVCKIPAVFISCAVTSNDCKIKVIILYFLPYTPVDNQQQQQKQQRWWRWWRRRRWQQQQQQQQQYKLRSGTLEKRFISNIIGETSCDQ